MKAPGDYVFSIQVDEGATVAIGDSTILWLDGGHWFEIVTSDTVRFEYAGSYPLRAYYGDCQPCCLGFRLGGMGPPGSGLMAFTPGFDFNADLGPCCTYSTNGPGISLVPAALFFLDPPTVSVGPGDDTPARRTLISVSASPNPFRTGTAVAVELARTQSVWAAVYDAAGREMATLAAGERRAAGVARWVWSPDWSGAGRATSGVYFFRVRTEDGATASGRLVAIR